MSDNWLTQSASDLGRGIAAGTIDPVALTEMFLEAIAASEVAPRVYARTTRKRALTEAAAARDRAAAGNRLGPLDGVPVSWKDLFDTAGVATEAGSDLLRDRIPGADAQVLQTAQHAGLVCLGKTHMSEFAFSGLGFNPVTETPPCVNNLSAVAGGSSSGAAASVAFGLAAAAIGSDTGGSVRIPAVWNDLVGLKTTAGLLPLRGVVPLCAKFDTVGPLCRTVEDAAQLLAALTGGKPADLTGADLSGRRFLVCKSNVFEAIEDQPAAAFADALTELSAAGAVIEESEIPEVSEAMPLSGCLYTVEAYAHWRDVIEDAPERMYGEILKRFRIGKTFSGPDYAAAWQKLERLRQGYLARTAGYDAVLAPTAAILPPNVDRLTRDHDYYAHANLITLRNTRIANLMGLASLTLPTGTPSCGLMLSTPPFSEHRLLRLGAAIEPVLRP